MLASILGAALLLPSSLLALPTLSPRQTETEADSAELTLPSRLPQKGTASLTDIKVEGNWTTIQCTAGSLTDARINEVDPNRRWVDSAADDAWKNLMDNWNVWRAANPTSTYPFVNFACVSAPPFFCGQTLMSSDQIELLPRHRPGCVSVRAE